jgi:hypothetical protein
LSRHECWAAVTEKRKEHALATRGLMAKSYAAQRLIVLTEKVGSAWRVSHRRTIRTKLVRICRTVWRRRVGARLGVKWGQNDRDTSSFEQR